MTESAEAENFDLPDTPPMEIRARDEPEQELLHWSIEQNVEKRKCIRGNVQILIYFLQF